MTTPTAAHTRRARYKKTLRQALARPETYSHRPASVEVRETHISWVFLAGELAYKLKKPLVLDFLDYGTPARRRELCAAEVRLNRRLAPDLYLGVRGVARTGTGRADRRGQPRAIDFVVEMRRYDEAQTLAARLERGELQRDDVVELGRRLARFHADAPRVAPDSAPILTAERRFEHELQELLAMSNSEERSGGSRPRAVRPRVHDRHAQRSRRAQSTGRSARATGTSEPNTSAC